MRLEVLSRHFAIVKLDPAAPVPEKFFSVTRTPEELSVVYETPEGEWRCLKVEGPLDFSLVGILASIVEPLARAGIPIFAISTFDTDHVLVKVDKVDAAIAALETAGHIIKS